MFEPFYGMELRPDLRQRRTESQSDIAVKVVRLSETARCVGGDGGQRKRKLDSSLDRTSKHIRRDNCDKTTDW